ncbi:MarC family protein [Thermofilum pendens]|uniref:MarC family protein n=1 Tax=Thermofilum pendens TaxID=2269 RepID=UPI00069C0450|nr:MarC family protein [Thermofilum pendens]
MGFVVESLKELWDTFLMLFIVVDSIGNIPIFYSLTSGMGREERIKIFEKSVAVASALLVFFAVFGYPFFQYYGVSFTDFKIAGGLLLLIIALQGVFGRVEAEALRSEDLAVVPMATPLLAGPGAIYMVMYLNSVYGLLPTLVSIALNTLASYLILTKSNVLLEKAGKNTILVLSRIFSLLLAVLAVSLIRSGIYEALRG